jgi:hypothetical protein
MFNPEAVSLVLFSFLFTAAVGNDRSLSFKVSQLLATNSLSALSYHSSGQRTILSLKLSEPHELQSFATLSYHSCRK